LNMTQSWDFGKYQASLRYDTGKGSFVKLQGPFDLYNADVKNYEVHLLDFWPEPGNYTIRLECVGKNPKSEGFFLGIESVQLRERRPRVLKMGWDKDKDWAKDPKLYG